MKPEKAESSSRSCAVKAEYLKALASGARIQILEFLRQGPRCVCEIPEAVGLEQPNVSQHLAVLRKHGMVSARRTGQRIIYSVSREEVFAMLDLVEKLVRAHYRDLEASFVGVGGAPRQARPEERPAS